LRESRARGHGEWKRCRSLQHGPAIGHRHIKRSSVKSGFAAGQNSPLRAGKPAGCA
jgi:hypothetical protein